MPDFIEPAGGALRVAFETLGCRSNYADTVELEAAVVERGSVPVRIDQPADVFVINTCTVTDDADKSALRLIRKVREKSPHARIVVTGCMAETGAEKIGALGAADAIVGPGKRADVIRAIFAEPLSHAASQPRIRRTRADWRSEALDRDLSPQIAGPGAPVGDHKSRVRYHLRVQEGCENSCTFCIIPSSRGQLNSRAPEKILEDLLRLHDLGYQEVVLTGTHLGGYGEDCGTSLCALLETLAAKSPVQRLRLSSIDPNDVSREMIDILAESHVFCPHLHICVQAFSDSVLKRMARRYRLAQVYEIVGHITDRLPGCCLGSDVIAGFPGERRQDVEQAIQVFLGLPFSYLHVFPYSERSGTAATRLDGVVPSAERKRRAARWRALSENRQSEFLRRHLGTPLEVVLEAGDGPYVHGVSREYAAVKIPAEALGDWRPGEARLLIAQSYDEVEGRIVCA